MEQHRIQGDLIKQGVRIITGHTLDSIRGQGGQLRCGYSGNVTRIDCMTMVPVTERVRNSSLYDELTTMKESGHGIRHLELLGDAATPGLIADAIYYGHLAARNFDNGEATADDQFFRREIPSLATAED